MGRLELRDENLRILTIRENASVVGRNRGPYEPRHEHGENQSHSYRRRRSRSPETLPRLGDERERTSSGSDQSDHRFERRIGMACIDDEIRAEYSATSTESHERNLQRESLPPPSSQLMGLPWVSGRRTFTNGNRLQEIVSFCQ